jgi:hypothetical protein
MTTEEKEGSVRHIYTLRTNPGDERETLSHNTGLDMYPSLSGVWIYIYRERCLSNTNGCKLYNHCVVFIVCPLHSLLIS